MPNNSENIQLLINLAKANSVFTKKFESGLGNGLGFNEFLILFYLDCAMDKKMRRVDLANKIGLSASGVTRLLLPMEKIGLVKSDDAATDARVKFVAMSKSGQEKFLETMVRLQDLVGEIMSPLDKNEIRRASALLLDFSGKFLAN